MSDATQALAVARTRHWLERAVIGLNLCPFAKSVHVKGQIHYAVSAATGWTPLLTDLQSEMATLVALPPSQRETTLLIAPLALPDFFEFNGFLAQAQRELEAAGHQGMLQLAAFHPQWEFAGVAAGDISHHTNRAPYPTLHLLRELSVARAVEALPDPAQIYETNIQTLRSLGQAGWHAWMREGAP